MNEEALTRTGFQGKLSEGFQKGQALDISGGATNFGDEDVTFFVLAHVSEAILNLVRNMRDDLNGFTEVVAPALLSKDLLVDLTGGEVVSAG